MFVWIWHLESIIKRSGGIEALVRELKLLGVDDLCIKFHEGSSDTGDGVNFRRDYLKYRDILKENGFKVGTWGYNYFNNISREVAYISEALKKSDYYIFDPEREVKNKESQAEDVLSIIRELYPQKRIGYSSYAVPRYHRELPFEVFDRYCDFFSPQVYYEEMGWSVEKCMYEMNKSLKDMRLKSPVVPSIQGYNQRAEIYREFSKLGYKDFGIWSLDFIDGDCREWLCTREENIPKEENKNWVLQIQKLLNSEESENKIKLQEDGVLGPKTLSQLKERLLRIGDSGKMVKILQEILVQKGSRLDIFGVDGEFGYETLRGVKDIQRRTEIEEDGIVGKNTWERLLS